MLKKTYEKPMLFELKLKKSPFQSEKVNFERCKSRVTKNLNHRMNERLAPLRVKIDITHAIQLKFQERMNKKQI